MTRPSLASLSAALVMVVTAGSLFAIALTGGSYDLVDRQTAAIAIWWAVGLGAIVLERPVWPAWPGLLATACAVGIGAWIAATLGSSISVDRSVTELARAVAHLGPFVLIGWVLPPRLWRAVFTGLVLGAVLISAASFGARVSPGFLGQTGTIVFETTTNRLASPFGYWNAVGSWSVLTAVLLLAVSAHHRAVLVRAAALAPLPLVASVGYLTYSRATIGALVVGIVVLMAVAKHRWTLLLHLGAAGAAGAAAVLAIRAAPEIADATGTAGAPGVVLTVLLAGLAAGAAGAATGRTRTDRFALARRPALGAFAVGVVCVAIGGSVAVDRYGDRAWDQFNTPVMDERGDPTQRLSTLSGTRLQQWRVAWSAWEENRTRGTGAGTFELVYNQESSSEEFVRDAHNAYVEALGEQGTPGLLLLVGLGLSMIAAVVFAALRAQDALDRGLIAGAGAALTAFTFGTALDWFWEVTALALLAMALLGVLVASAKPGGSVPEAADDAGAAHDRATAAERLAARERAAADRPTAPASPPVARYAGPALRAALVAAAVLAVLIELPGLVGTSELRRSQRDVAAGDISAARAHADQAIEIMYWASSPFLQRALVDEAGGDWAAARRAITLAQRRDPQDWRLPLVRARIEARAGRPAEALRAYRAAERLRPNGAFFR